MEDKKDNKGRGYSLRIEKDISIGGVKKAVECTQTLVRLELACGMLTIRGKELDIKKLDLESGEAVMTGFPAEITWGGVGGKSLVRKLFK